MVCPVRDPSYSQLDRGHPAPAAPTTVKKGLAVAIDCRQAGIVRASSEWAPGRPAVDTFAENARSQFEWSSVFGASDRAIESQRTKSATDREPGWEFDGASLGSRTVAHPDRSQARPPATRTYSIGQGGNSDLSIVTPPPFHTRTSPQTTSATTHRSHRPHNRSHRSSFCPPVPLVPAPFPRRHTIQDTCSTLCSSSSDIGATVVRVLEFRHAV